MAKKKKERKVEKMGEPSLWVPTQDIVELAHLGKLLEELGEAVSIAARIIIQGVHMRDPKTKIGNRARLEDELADVRAMSEMVAKLYGLDKPYMRARADEKQNHKARWYDMLREHVVPTAKGGKRPKKKRRS